MFDRPIVFLDLETTGASADRDRITEIGLIEVNDGEFADEWSTLVNPDRPMSAGVSELTGITEQMLSSAPRFADLSEQLFKRLDGRLLIAHNARFDYAFLRAEFKRLGVRFRQKALCTVRLSRLLFPEHTHHNLDVIIDRFGLSCTARHRALGDAQVLWSFARELRRRVDAGQLKAAVESLTQLPTLPPGIDPERFEDLPVAPGVYVFYADDGRALYAGRSDNLRSRVLAHFNASGASAFSPQTASFEWIETAGALGAALREVALRRSLDPIHNRSQSAGEAWSMLWSADGDLTLVDLQEHVDSPSAALYGAFRSRKDALAALCGLARGHRLCRIMLGLETGPGPCSAYRVDGCRGACVEIEHRSMHAIRLASALARLRLPQWPFSGRVAVSESDPSRAVSEVHVLERWRYLGSARTEPELDALAQQRTLPDFDIDQFRIIARHLAQPGARKNIRDLNVASGVDWQTCDDSN